MAERLFGGIDVGSTTVKLVVMNSAHQTLFSRYERHYADVKAASERVIKEAIAELGGDTPIASRCGVFAKTDVQPLINDGARKEDIAASIFQAVVNQTISGLAAGHKISGHVAFLGGPLYFMDQLRHRFIETFHLTDDEVIFPENPQLFVAQGAALYANDQPTLSLDILLDRLEHGDSAVLAPSHALDPLFNNDDELAAFRQRHAKD